VVDRGFANRSSQTKDSKEEEQRLVETESA
jgi:hypothetical protein